MSDHLDALRHSCAHLLAAAVEQHYPHAKRTIGPPVKDGFYYDFDFTTDTGEILAPTEHDFPMIEKTMKELVASWNVITHKEVSPEEALEFFAGNPYKQELIREFSGEGSSLTLYTSGNFTDLCKGGHIESPAKQLRFFSLQKIAGAYWRGDSSRPMLTRIYGTCFSTKEELRAHLSMLEEAKKRDHRKLGKELDLFTFSPLVGSGLPLFTPKGTILREQLRTYSEELRTRIGFQHVHIPHITKKDLYETSGHWQKFGDELFLVESQETDDEMVLKPMNCPHHTQIFASRPRSYRELPIKYLETTTIYRDEKAGELLGLSRVRSITQDDSHTFCTREQIADVYSELIAIVKELYAVVDMPLKARLSYRDKNKPEQYIGDPALWDQAESIIKDIAVAHELDYYEAEGEAAFYGPKIDFMAVDALGREWQVATPQLDFVQPERFGLSYVGEDGKEHRPVMIHFALLGSIERFLSVYIEHTAGNFPLWLSPVQVVIIPVSEKHVAGADTLLREYRGAGIRVEMYDADDTVGKKIRTATMQKPPYILVVGDKELSGGDLTVRVRGQEAQRQVPHPEFLLDLKKRIETKTREL